MRRIFKVSKKIIRDAVTSSRKTKSFGKNRIRSSIQKWPDGLRKRRPSVTYFSRRRRNRTVIQTELLENRLLEREEGAKRDGSP